MGRIIIVNIWFFIILVWFFLPHVCIVKMYAYIFFCWTTAHCNNKKKNLNGTIPCCAFQEWRCCGKHLCQRSAWISCIGNCDCDTRDILLWYTFLPFLYYHSIIFMTTRIKKQWTTLLLCVLQYFDLNCLQMIDNEKPQKINMMHSSRQENDVCIKMTAPWKLHA